MRLTSRQHFTDIWEGMLHIAIAVWLLMSCSSELDCSEGSEKAVSPLQTIALNFSLCCTAMQQGRCSNISLI